MISPNINAQELSHSTPFLFRCTEALCVYFFILNLTSGLFYLKYSADLQTVAYIIGLSGLVALLSSTLCEYLRRWRPLFISIAVILSIIFNIPVLLDSFMLYCFNGIFNQDAMDVIADTNPKEASGFLKSYLSWKSVVTTVFAITIYNIVSWLIASFSKKLKFTRYCMIAIALGGCITIGECVTHYVKYGSGKAIPQCNAILRAAYSFKIVKDNQAIIEDMVYLSRMAEASAALPADSLPDIVVVIGESHSVFHSQLYGYNKNTEPYISAMADTGAITIYRDAISPWDITIRAMQAIFTTSDTSTGLQASPLFPALFKNAGYNTEMYDNQYFVGNGVSILSDKELSDAMFDKRNSVHYRYDIDMVEDMNIKDVPTLYVIHLIGQHYTYADRYPEQFNIFAPTDYPPQPRNSLSNNDIIAHYDNATRSTDYTLHRIIEKFQNRDCAIIYFSDHGEEVYDYSNNMGHGYATDAEYYDYQIRVPLWIWLSDKYRNNRPKLAQQVDNSSSLPVSTNDIAQVILRLGLIDSPYFDKSRCFIDPDYDLQRKRIIFYSIDFDQVSKIAMQ